MEALEGHMLLSTVTMTGGLLSIVGNSTADTIDIGLNAAGDKVTVKINNEAEPSFKKSGLHLIRARAWGKRHNSRHWEYWRPHGPRRRRRQ